ncbi:hypothetical protein BS17DRAFT_123933 [Gyrodon lividus]|nr:hypothetical protein BS17DRAFT_123933 [Gyrodon lividus]
MYKNVRWGLSTFTNSPSLPPQRLEGERRATANVPIDTAMPEWENIPRIPLECSIPLTHRTVPNATHRFISTNANIRCPRYLTTEVRAIKSCTVRIITELTSRYAIVIATLSRQGGSVHANNTILMPKSSGVVSRQVKTSVVLPQYGRETIVFLSIDDRSALGRLIPQHQGFIFLLLLSCLVSSQLIFSSGTSPMISRLELAARLSRAYICNQIYPLWL